MKFELYCCLLLCTWLLVFFKKTVSKMGFLNTLLFSIGWTNRCSNLIDWLIQGVLFISLSGTVAGWYSRVFEDEINSGFVKYVKYISCLRDIVIRKGNIHKQNGPFHCFLSYVCKTHFLVCLCFCFVINPLLLFLFSHGLALWYISENAI